ncbi:MAG: hypothetical protein K1X83_07370 [Oligoflexia bacterium]|nr:hypothetical protein [Oligoflexia bacterium]
MTALQITPVLREASGWIAPRLEYHGGKVLNKPLFYSLYLGTYWKTPKGQDALKYNDQFTKDFMQSPQMGFWKEYNAGKGRFVGSKTISSSNLPKRIDEYKLMEVIEEQLRSGHVAKPNSQTVYTVYLPPGSILVASDGTTSLDGLGGYHGSYDRADGTRVYYAAIAYGQGNNGIPFSADPRDNLSIVASHEWTEAVTDPDVNNGTLAWYDERLGEVSDIPMNMGMQLDEVWGRINGYAVQKEWSNKDQAVELVPGEYKPAPASPSRNNLFVH